MFDKPIIILSSPRAGSTLLFEIMQNCKDVWSIGDESHQVIESIPSLRIAQNGFSNRLDESNITTEIIQTITNNFQSRLCDRSNNALPSSFKSVRFLEKTPKNSLRIPFLDKIFPDAIFIYLVRDPCENISSIMDAWKSGHWVTYRNLPNCDKPWSLLLPPDWEIVKSKSLQEIAAFQWATSNNYILSDLKNISPKRWTTISYHELINDTNEQIKRLCDFCNIEFDRFVDNLTNNTLPDSKYTLTKPTSDKWKKNEIEIAQIYPSLNKYIKSIDDTLHDNRQFGVNWHFNIPIKNFSRNANCPCGSGKKYKRCHGKST